MGLTYTPKSGRKPNMQVDFATGLLTQDPTTTGSTPVSDFGDTSSGADKSFIWGIPMVWIGEQWLQPVTGATTTSSLYMFSGTSEDSQWPCRILSIRCYFTSGMDATDYDGTNGNLLLAIKAAGVALTPGTAGLLSLKYAENNKMIVDLPGQEVFTPNVLNLAAGDSLLIDLKGRLEDGSGSSPTLKMITQIKIVRMVP